MNDELESTAQLAQALMELRQRVSELKATLAELQLAAARAEDGLTEQARRDSEEQYFTIFAKSPFAMTLTKMPEIIIVNVNEAFEKLFEYTCDEVIGKSSVDLGISDAESRARVAAELQAHGRVRDFKVVRIAKSGTRRVLTLNLDWIHIGGERYLLTTIQDLTERMLAEEALHASEERYRLIAQNAEDIIWTVNMELGLTYASPSLERILGYTAQEILEMRLEQFLTPESFALGMAVFQEEVTSAEQVRDPNYARVLELEYCRKDGSTVWLEVKFSFFRNADGAPTGVLGVGRDITHRKQVTQALRASEARFRKMMDDMLEGCQIIGFDWQYLYVNKVVAGQGKQTREALLGHTMMEMYPGIERTPLFETLKQCMTERVARKIENEFHFPDASVGWFELSIEPMPEGIFILSMDITDRKRGEFALRTSYAQIELQVQRLAAMHAIDLAINANVELDITIEIFLAHVISRLGVDAAALLLLDPVLDVLEFTAARGFSGNSIASSRVQVGEGAAGRAALGSSPLHIPNLAESEPPFLRASLIANEGFVTYFAFPLFAKGQLKGLLELYHRSPLEPDADWLEFFESLGSQAAIAIENAELYASLQRSNIELELAYDATIEGWSHALDLRDHETEGHTRRVTELTLQLARAAGMEESELVHLRRGALLHDMGKLGVPDAVLLKPNKLSEEEWVLMRQHPQHAFNMLSRIEYLRPALDIPYYHHEKWDGTGYPRGLKGQEIPFAARLFAVADVWDALRSDRPYRKAWSADQALEYIRARAGTHFDPQVVELFFQIIAA